MKAFAAILLFALFLGLSSQVDVVTYIIDDFSVDSPAIVVVTPSGGVTSTIITSNFITDSNILGEERDIEVDVLSGTGNVVVSAGVSGGSFQSAAPQQATAVSYLIYDGPDGSIDLDPSGLFPYDADFTASNSYAMQANITSDTTTNVYFRGYSGSSTSYCEFTLNIPGDQVSRLYVMQYTQFTTVGSGCNFANLGALEVEVRLAANVDIVIEIIELIAQAPSSTPTPSPSPSRAAASASNTPSISRTPTPSRVAASASNTPTNSRSPSPSPSSSGCLCTCPEFECYMFNMGTYSFVGTTN